MEHDSNENNGIEKGDVPDDEIAAPSKTAGCTLQQYAEHKKLPVVFLTDHGLSQISYQGALTVRIPYSAEDGSEAAVRFRTALIGNDRFRWKNGSKPCLYGLSQINTYDPKYVVLVEGESDAQTLWYHGIPALGVPGANAWKEGRDAPKLNKFDTVYVVIEPDHGGESVKKWIAKSEIRDRVVFFSLGEYKDPSQLYVVDPDQFMTVFNAAASKAVKWTDLNASDLIAERNAAWEQCTSSPRSAPGCPGRAAYRPD